MSLNPGDLIQEKYRITRLIGQGGMGAVYEGENVVIARRVAIKVLHGNLAGDGSVIERFEREAQAAGRIGNDHILEVLDMGRLDNNDRFMVMEYLDGETLDQRCERLTRLTDAELYPILRQLLTGLSAAHAAGIVHRDLKPDNIFILQHKAGQRDFVKIIDFGISKFTAGAANFRMTMTGAIMGTPYYMAPEQAKGGKNVDMRSDVYAVGVVMFKALTGQVPFQAESFNELIFKIALSETPRASALVPELDPELDEIVYKAMARNVEDRFQSAAQLRGALDAWADARGFSAPGFGRGSQVGLERELRGTGTRQTPEAHIGHGETVTAMQEATHAPWSNSGISHPNKSRTLGIAIGAFLVVGGVAVWALTGGEEKPVAEVPTSPSAHAAVPSTIVAPAADPRPPEPKPEPVSDPKPEQKSPDVPEEKQPPATPTRTPEPAAETRATETRVPPVPAPKPAVRPAPAPAPKPVVRPAPSPVVRPAPAPAPAPKPVVKPAPKPRDLLGY